MEKQYRWLNEASQVFLERDYLLEGQTLDERVDIICKKAEEILKIEGFAEKFKENIQKGWYSLSTPIWTNFGNDRGLPISCFGSYVDDNMESILYTAGEIGMMSKYGGGTSAYYGSVRPRGASITNNGESSGSVHFMQMPNSIVNVISQGKTRRGNFAAYLDIFHEDIMEFLTIRSEGSPIQDISFGVCVPDWWMQEMIDGNKKYREVWAKVLQIRSEFGFPYIFFTDNVNNNTVDVYKDKGMKIHASQMCTEIALPSSVDESFVCDLASVNLLYYDEWKDTDSPKLLTYFLDAVMTEFIVKLKKIENKKERFLPTFMERALRFAERHRAIGIGALGWHSYLQKNKIPFESFKAKMINIQIFKLLKEKTYEASAELAIIFGEPEVLKGYGRRNTTTMAIAPTKSSAFILEQVSECMEAQKANIFIKDLAKIKYTYKNPYLIELLEELGKNTIEVWNDILMHGGSVQHLDFLSQNDKNVFKTSSEISQKEIIIQAAARQKYIDQAQSINLTIHPDTPTKDINKLIIEAWQSGIKTLYYQHSVNAAQQFSRDILNCSSCES